MKTTTAIAFGTTIGIAITLLAVRESAQLSRHVMSPSAASAPYSRPAAGTLALRVSKGEMLVLENAEATALIELTGYSEHGAQYQWRGRVKHGYVGRGTGVLTERFESPRQANRVSDANSDVLVAAGAFDVAWSYSDLQSGWLYIDPHRVNARIIPATQFETYALAEN